MIITIVIDSVTANFRRARVHRSIVVIAIGIVAAVSCRGCAGTKAGSCCTTKSIVISIYIKSLRGIYRCIVVIAIGIVAAVSCRGCAGTKAGSC